ncbi:free fatty acid receptor 3 [Embiotoca jacksoni]|uniref:free fatty acid receptor 3 n=1 Tax=Embiotoca jacksoni TaxID=100190 RepID=UPI00370463A3
MSNKKKDTTPFQGLKLKIHNQAPTDRRQGQRRKDFPAFITMILWKTWNSYGAFSTTRTIQQSSSRKVKYSHWQRSIMESGVESEFILSVYIISFLIGFPSNLLALYAFSVKIHSKPLPTDILLLNLTVSDLLFLLTLPLKMHEAASDMNWKLPNFLCSFTAFTFFSTIYTSSLLLMAVSMVRYMAVAFPVTYHQLLKPVHTIAISAGIWIISGAHCSIVFFTLHHPSLSSTDSGVCYGNFTERQLEILLPVRLEMFTVLALAPLLVCVYCYSRCISILYSLPNISPMQKQKAIGMALGTVAVFLICVLPYNVSHIVGYIQGESPQWRYYSLLLVCFNTCIDPIIFYFSSSIFHCTGEKSIFKKLGLPVAAA